MLHSGFTLSTLVNSVRKRIGDSNDLGERIWTDDEIEDYLRDGYEALCLETGLIWDRCTMDDLPMPGNWNYDFEAPFFVTFRKPAYSGITALDSEIWVRCYQFEYTHPWERDWAFSPRGPASSSFPWEREYDTTLQCSAVLPLPDGALQVERATWNERHIPALRSSELEKIDSLYESGRSSVLAFTQDKDGLASFRKWHIPSSSASVPYTDGVTGIPRGIKNTTPTTHYMHLDEWGWVFDGVLDAAPSPFGDFVALYFTLPPKVTAPGWSLPADAGFSDFAVSGDYGLLRRLPGHHPSRSVWGFARHVSTAVRNTVIEFRRTGEKLELKDQIDQPINILAYIRHYACWQALRRRGPGQHPALASHYQARWLSGLERLNTRRRRMQQQEVYQYGDGRPGGAPPLAQPGPDLNYGQMEGK